MHTSITYCYMHMFPINAMFSLCHIYTLTLNTPLQDLYLDHLTSRTHSLDEQLALYDAQCSGQAQETKAIKEALTEATMELEV